MLALITAWAVGLVGFLAGLGLGRHGGRRNLGPWLPWPQSSSKGSSEVDGVDAPAMVPVLAWLVVVESHLPEGPWLVREPVEDGTPEFGIWDGSAWRDMCGDLLERDLAEATGAAQSEQAARYARLSVVAWTPLPEAPGLW